MMKAINLILLVVASFIGSAANGADWIKPGRAKSHAASSKNSKSKPKNKLKVKKLSRNKGGKAKLQPKSQVVKAKAKRGKTGKVAQKKASPKPAPTQAVKPHPVPAPVAEAKPVSTPSPTSSPTLTSTAEPGHGLAAKAAPSLKPVAPTPAAEISKPVPPQVESLDENALLGPSLLLATLSAVFGGAAFYMVRKKREGQKSEGTGTHHTSSPEAAFGSNLRSLDIDRKPSAFPEPLPSGKSKFGEPLSSNLSQPPRDLARNPDDTGPGSGPNGGKKRGFFERLREEAKARNQRPKTQAGPLAAPNDKSASAAISPTSVNDLKRGLPARPETLEASAKPQSSETLARSERTQIGPGTGAPLQDTATRNSIPTFSEADAPKLDFAGWDQLEPIEFWNRVKQIEDAANHSDAALYPKLKEFGLRDRSQFEAIRAAYVERHGPQAQKPRPKDPAPAPSRVASPALPKAEQLAPIHGVDLKTYAAIMAKRSRQILTPEETAHLLQSFGIDQATFDQAHQGWQKRLTDQSDAPALAALVAEYARHVANASDQSLSKPPASVVAA